MTNALLKASMAAGFPLLDHVITNGTKYYSLRQKETSPLPFSQRVDLAWEAFGNYGAKILVPSNVHNVARFLRQDGDNGVVFYLDRLNRITTARLLPTTLFNDDIDEEKRFRAVAGPALNLQSRHAVVYLPQGEHVSIIGKISAIADRMFDIGIDLADVVQASNNTEKGYLSYRAAGLFSPKSKEEEVSFGNLGDVST